MATFFKTPMSIDDGHDFDECQEIFFTNAQFIFRSYLFPFTYLFGLISNTINILVFTQKSMRNQPVNWFFLALSVSDLITLVSSFFVFSVPVYAETSGDTEFIKLSVHLIAWFYPLAQTGLTMSVYVTILVSVHRYLGVCHPFLIRRISNSTAVKRIIIAAVVFAFVFNTSRWFELHSMACYSKLHQANSSAIQPTSLMINNVYTLIYRNAAYQIVMFFLPFAVLTYVNLRIIATLQQSYKMRREMTTPRVKKDSTVPIATETVLTKIEGYSTVVAVDNNNTAAAQNDRKENGVTIMLVAITTEFLLFNLIAFANNIIELSNIRIFFQDVETLLVEVSTFLVNVNGASTIIIYLIFGSKYRAVFMRLIQKYLRIKTCEDKKRPMYSQAHFETTQLLENSRLDLNRSKQMSVLRRTDITSMRSSSRRE
ncbi:unnamed protein product [Caenorhabditis angaria]|uniref:G-protein coupled receptors family 1 profile domain-containing protein n=1 Tax=Caenorhabditis angaria TaxID=860376 RepID=A0A9P1N8V1_9PELO|nr:unnamed protein product [Caenorhabditis angaria]